MSRLHPDLRFVLPVIIFCALSCSSKAGDTPPDGKTGQQAAASRSGAVTAAQLDTGQRLLSRIIAGMGGHDAIGAIQTLSLDGKMARPHSAGRETQARVRTFVKFPNAYRQELELPGATVTTVIGPAGAWILTANDAPLPLPEERRREIEDIILRNPVALLKTKDSELFSVVATKPEGDDKAADEVLIRVGTKETTITLDSRGLIEKMSYEMPGPDGKLKRSLTVHYSDYRSVGSVLYPFSSKAESEGAVMYRVELKSVKANELLPSTLFEPGKTRKER